MLKVRVLGAGGGELAGISPVSFLINDHLIVDAGSITSTLTLKEQQKIRYLLLTHSHMDHMKDICFLAENLHLAGKSDSIEFYSSDAILTDITKHVFNGIIWPNFSKIPTKRNPIYRFRSIKKHLSLDGLTVKAIAVHHSHSALGYIISDPTAAIVISGDTGPTEALWEAANREKKLKAIFVECSFPAQLSDLAWKTKHLSSLSLPRELKKIKKNDIPIYLYHLKPIYAQKIRAEIKNLKNDWVKILKPQVYIFK